MPFVIEPDIGMVDPATAARKAAGAKGISNAPTPTEKKGFAGVLLGAKKNDTGSSPPPPRKPPQINFRDAVKGR